MKRRGRDGGSGGGSGKGGGSGHGGADGKEGEVRLRIHLKRSCTNRKLVPQESSGLGLTTDDWQKFKRLLESKTFAVHDTKRVRGEDLTAAWAKADGFREPVIAVDKKGTGLKVPDASFTVADVARVVGEEVLIRPIHVGEQANISQHMTLAEFAEYFETCTKPGQAILNMISLEFSETPLAKMVTSPQLVRDMDWVDWCWPEDRKGEEQFPKVQYYCLMSQGGSYTDFHVDFGGTSVWYHILRGKKEFLLIRPTPSNLKLYEDWITSPSQNQVFFGDVADTCYRVVLNAGETLMIPSGWIHAVFTPKPSLVFGGNFLHSLNIHMQLQIHAIEVRAKILHKFRFPFFREMMFFAASKYLRLLRDRQGNAPGRETTSSSGNGENGPEQQNQSPGERKHSGGAPGVSDASVFMSTSSGGGGESGGAAVPSAAHGSAVVSHEETGGARGMTTELRKGGVADAAERVGLNEWEMEGLPSLLEACRTWLAAGAGKAGGVGGNGGGGEDGVMAEWELAAAAAGCPTVEVMLQELSARMSAMQAEADCGAAEGTSTMGDECVAPGTETSALPLLLNSQLGSASVRSSTFELPPDTVASSVRDLACTGKPSSLDRAAANAVDAADATLPSPATVLKEGGTGGGEGGVAAAAGDESDVSNVKNIPSGGSSDSSTSSSRGSVRAVAAPAAAVAMDMKTNGTLASPSAAAASYSIPKLKISLKAPSSSIAENGKSTAGGGGSNSGGGLKLVLKRPGLSSSCTPSPRGGGDCGGSESASGSGDEASGHGGGDTVDRNRGGRGVSALLAVGEGALGAAEEAIRRKGPSPHKKTQPPVYLTDSEEDEDMIDGHHDESSSSDGSDGEARVGRGSKRKARPLGSRLRAIARLGDEAAAGGSSDDDSADEYKPELEDDTRPDDHKIKLDSSDIQESKRVKAAARGSAAKSGNTWSGFGGGGSGDAVTGGAAAGGGRGGGALSAGNQRRGGMFGGGMRLSVTKQQALRSKGVFKIAPPSKLPVAAKKEKKPLTAKQKLLAKMRR